MASELGSNDEEPTRAQLLESVFLPDRAVITKRHIDAAINLNAYLKSAPVSFDRPIVLPDRRPKPTVIHGLAEANISPEDRIAYVFNKISWRSLMTSVDPPD